MEIDLTSLNTQISEVQAAVTRRKKMKRQLKRVNAELADRRRRLGALYKSLRKEEEDVNKLEKTTVTALFQRILGNLDAQREIERQEYLVVVLKYNECIDMIELLEYEASVLTSRIDELPAFTQQLDALLERKIQVLKVTSTEVSTALKLLENKELLIQRRQTEITEALNAGKIASGHLRGLFNGLKKVRYWGYYELQGAGRYSTYAKKTFIDTARKSAMAAKVALDKYEMEVQDVFKELKIKDRFEIASFENFLEILYENALVDWIVQKKASNMLNHIALMLDKVARIKATLTAEQDKQKAALRMINTKRREIVQS